MSALLFGHEEAVAAWVGGLNGKQFTPPYTAFGVVDGGGTLRGGFVFTGFNGDGVEMSLAGRGCVNRGAMAAVADYVFRQLGCARLQVHTRASNRAVRKQAPKLGLRYEGKSRSFYGNEDGLVYSLTKDDLGGFRRRWKLD